MPKKKAVSEEGTTVKRERSEISKAMTALNAAVVKRDKLRASIKSARERLDELTLKEQDAAQDAINAREAYEKLAQ